MIARFAEAGFDLAHPFDAHAIARELGVRELHDPARPGGWLIGNTRALWPVFLAARRADPALTASAHPLDRYVEDRCAAITSAPALFAHRTYGATWLPFQRIAAAAGFGALAPTNLLIHPTYGPWFALRAIVLTEAVPATRRLPQPLCNCGAARCGEAFERALDAQESWSAWLALRDACTVGREHRYSDDQVAYHYTKQRDLLK